MVKIDTKRVTVKQFRDEVLVKALNMIEPDVITEGKGLVLISSEEGETDCNNDKKLCELDVVDGCILKVDDFVQQYELTVIIAHKDVERDGDLFEVIADPDSLKPESVEEKPESPKEPDNGEPRAKKARHEPQEDSDDDLCIVEDGENDSNCATTSGLSTTKNSEQNKQTGNNDVVTVIDDDKMDFEGAPSTSSSEVRNKRARIEPDDDDLIIIEDD